MVPIRRCRKSRSHGRRSHSRARGPVANSSTVAGSGKLRRRAPRSPTSDFSAASSVRTRRSWYSLTCSTKRFFCCRREPLALASIISGIPSAISRVSGLRPKPIADAAHQQRGQQHHQRERHLVGPARLLRQAELVGLRGRVQPRRPVVVHRRAARARAQRRVGLLDLDPVEQHRSHPEALLGLPGRRAGRAGGGRGARGVRRSRDRPARPAGTPAPSCCGAAGASWCPRPSSSPRGRSARSPARGAAGPPSPGPRRRRRG